MLRGEGLVPCRVGGELNLDEINLPLVERMSVPVRCSGPTEDVPEIGRQMPPPRHDLDDGREFVWAFHFAGCWNR